jgi:hypothetical protein
MKKKNLLMTAIAVFGIATTTLAQVPSYVPTNGLIGWWPFNGNANDGSGNNNNGTVIGAVSTIDRFGSTNNAFSFNGTSDYIRCVNAGPTGNPNITLSFWVKTSQTTASDIFNWGNGTIAGQDFRALLNEVGCAGVTFDNYNSAITYSTTTNNNTWEHYVVVYDSIVGSSVLSSRAYKNGILLSSVCFTQNFNQTNIGSANPITIGRYNELTSTPQPPNYFSGTLDDIGFWNRVLTQQEITDLYAGCQLSINTQPSNQQININNNAQFVVGSSDPLATYQWQTDLGVGFQNLNNVGQYSGTANDTLTIANTTLSNNNQPFRCIVSSGSCKDTSNVAILTVNNNVGINEFTQDNLFSVYPNPAKSQINVKADAKLLGSIYTIYDNTGKLVLTGKINSDNTVIELDNLSGGIYLFSVGENMKQTFKVIKE